MWNKLSNKDTNIIALSTAFNDQMMKFLEFKKNYNDNGNNKIIPNEKNPSGDPGGNNSKLRVTEWRIKFKVNTIPFDGKKWDWSEHHNA